MSPARNSAAASATAPPGSNTIFKCANASAIALSASASLTASPGPASRSSTGNVSAPGRAVRIASQMDPVAAAFPTRSPAASDRAISSNPAGSAVRTLRPGASASKASATPALSPPPPHGTSTSASATPASAACAAISSPSVPCPAITSGWSNGGIRLSFRSAASRAPSASRSSRARSQSTTSAP